MPSLSESIVDNVGENHISTYLKGKGYIQPDEKKGQALKYWVDDLLKGQKINIDEFEDFLADDKLWNDKSALEISDAVRDNVLFEHGLFTGALGKENVCFVCKGKPKLAADLRGVTYIDGNLGDALIKAKLKDWLDAIK